MDNCSSSVYSVCFKHASHIMFSKRSGNNLICFIVKNCLIMNAVYVASYIYVAVAVATTADTCTQ